MIKVNKLPFIVFCSAILLLVSCSQGSDPAGKAVERYLTALVAKDATQLSTISCADWETSALTEMDSLQAVTAKLDNLSCKTSSKEGNFTYVSCTGKILMTYNSENQELDLSLRTYKVIQQGGESLMCGYK